MDAFLPQGVWKMPDRLLISNVPRDCSEEVLKRWIEDRGFSVQSLKLIRDFVSGTSPSFAHVTLAGAAEMHDARHRLDGEVLRGCALSVNRMLEARPVSAARAAGTKTR